MTVTLTMSSSKIKLELVPGAAAPRAAAVGVATPPGRRIYITWPRHLTLLLLRFLKIIIIFFIIINSGNSSNRNHSVTFHVSIVRFLQTIKTFRLLTLAIRSKHIADWMENGLLLGSKVIFHARFRALWRHRCSRWHEGGDLRFVLLRQPIAVVGTKHEQTEQSNRTRLTYAAFPTYQSSNFLKMTFWITLQAPLLVACCSRQRLTKAFGYVIRWLSFFLVS